MSEIRRFPAEVISVKGGFENTGFFNIDLGFKTWQVRQFPIAHDEAKGLNAGDKVVVYVLHSGRRATSRYIITDIKVIERVRNNSSKS